MDDNTLEKEWHDSKKPEQVSHGSHYLIEWKCSHCGGIYHMRYHDRLRGKNCPYCSGRRVLVGYNDLETLYPAIAREWCRKNNDEHHLGTPRDYTSHSGKKVWWKCDNALHDPYLCDINSRTSRKRGCPQCSNRKVVKGVNDVATLRPDLEHQWYYFMNRMNGLGEPCDYPCYSSKKVWWKCGRKNHPAYLMSIAHKASGESCPYCKGRLVKGVNDISSLLPDIAGECKDPKKMENATIGCNDVVQWECGSGHTWYARISERCGGHKTRCPSCSHRRSKGENEISHYISSLFDGIDIQRSVRISSIANCNDNTELDIYLPSLHIAIEYNGVYWHSDKYRDNNYHYKKMMSCNNNGIRLIQIWQDQWEQKPDIIKDYLSQILNVNDTIKKDARKLRITSVSTTVAGDFLEQNHIQGNSSANNIRIGLEDESGRLFALMTGFILDGEFHLNRYASLLHHNVRGGFTKILHFITKKYKGNITRITTFSDNMITIGNVYSANGFHVDKIIPPDYQYVVNGNRVHKFNYRKSRFKKDDGLLYHENYTESQLADINHLYRVWDAGKIKWDMEIL